MGTRADFYVGRDDKAEWLGSIVWNGYPTGIPDAIKKATDADAYRREGMAFIEGRRDGTKPADGWPWPWNDSRTTDYAYAFDDGRVLASCFGHAWFDASKPPLAETDEDSDPQLAGEKVATFPDMSERKAVTLGERSGVIVFSI